jgi:hypothetical protein
VESGKPLTVHQVQEIEKLVQDALANLDQVQYALRTLEERLRDREEEGPRTPEQP